MNNFPTLDRFDIKFPDGYLGNQAWIQSQHTGLHSMVIVDEYALMPSMDKDTLYIGYAGARYNRTIDAYTGETNYIKSSKLTIISEDVEVLTDNIHIDVAIDTNLDYQELLFIDNKMPIFKIDNLSEEKEITLAFKIVSKDVEDKSFIDTAYFNISYKTTTKKGDLNGDGTIDLKDLVVLSNHVIGEENALYPEAGDISGDGNTNIFDIVLFANSILRGDYR